MTISLHKALENTIEKVDESVNIEEVLNGCQEIYVDSRRRGSLVKPIFRQDENGAQLEFEADVQVDRISIGCKI